MLIFKPPRALLQVTPPGNGHQQRYGCLLVCQGSRNNSRSNSSSLDGGLSFSKLPISQQSISMAFQVLDKDEDGRISRWDFMSPALMHDNKDSLPSNGGV